MQSNEIVEVVQEELFETGKTKKAKDPDYVEKVFDLTPEGVERRKKKKMSTLGIRCGRSDCKSNLHCFSDRSSARIRRRSEPRISGGKCRDCGRALVDWNMVHVRDLRTVSAKFECFQTEWIRHFFFHVPITERVDRYARKHGLVGLAKIFEHQLTEEKMLRYIPALDYNQTKMLDGTIVHWARHATASCCRACMKYWHDIPLDRRLTAGDISYLRDLAMRFIRLRMPTLEPASKTYTADVSTSTASAR
jgi:hypothetical protein